jgi:hypothetical protein
MMIFKCPTANRFSSDNQVGILLNVSLLKATRAEQGIGASHPTMTCNDKLMPASACLSHKELFINQLYPSRSTYSLATKNDFISNETVGHFAPGATRSATVERCRNTLSPLNTPKQRRKINPSIFRNTKNNKSPATYNYTAI